MIYSPKDWVRLLLAGHFRRKLARASQDYDPAAASALVVSPHPDDESLGCGGLIAAKCKAGQRVDVLFLTAGEASHPGHPLLAAAELSERRRQEARSALALLGVPPERMHFWDLPDGRLGEAGEANAAGERLARLIRQLGPGEIFTPFHGGGSSEHSAAFLLTRRSLAEAGGGRLMEYPVWGWWNAFRLSGRLDRGREPGNRRLPLGGLRALKRRAVACHRSQVEPTPPWAEPVLPPVLVSACCGPVEFFFASDIPPAQTP
ncbi:MAG TPA: PIG-L family deacetylase [Opitutaceae bacterium]|nr:PIG-L family deacetylase [Opitutaceae bacterium]